MSRKNLYWLFSVVTVSLLVFGIYQYFSAKAYKQGLEDTYNRAFFELTDYVDDIDTLLAKSMLATSAGELAGISQELSVQANSAKACLAQIPITEVPLDKTEKFLSQVGDYTYTLSQSVINKKGITEDEYESLLALGHYATGLNSSLAELSKKVYDGSVRFGSGALVGKNGVAYAANEEMFSAIEKKFGEYPSLIYDGPFSEHIESMKPKLLEGKEEWTKEQAQRKAATFLGVEEDAISFSGEVQNTNLPAYMFRGKRGRNDICISMSKTGGEVVYFLESKRFRIERLKVDEAIQKAKEFLEKKGYESMTESYYDKADGVATINFAYKQNNVTCYSDLIKVKVGLDSGDIVGMEANGYIMNHCTRDLRTPALKKEDARNKVTSRFGVSSVDLALIPKDSKREVLCYEFKGSFASRNFLIYINAETGEQEDIQMLIESADGILTI